MFPRLSSTRLSSTRFSANIRELAKLLRRNPGGWYLRGNRVLTLLFVNQFCFGRKLKDANSRNHLQKRDVKENLIESPRSRTKMKKKTKLFPKFFCNLFSQENFSVFKLQDSAYIADVSLGFKNLVF